MSSPQYNLIGSLGGSNTVASENSVYQIQGQIGLALPTTSRFIWGDLNNDGQVGVDDVLMALQVAIGAGFPSEAQLLTGDVVPLRADGRRGDGSITIADVTFLLRLSIGLEKL